MLASGIVALALTQVFGLTVTGLGPIGIGAEAPGVTNAIKEDAVDRRSRPRPPTWPPGSPTWTRRSPRSGSTSRAIDRVSPILAGQWFLAFTDTWTLDANAMASITTLRGPGEVPAVAERILLRRPDAVVIVRREDVAAVRRAVGPDPGAAGRTACDRGADRARGAGHGRRPVVAVVAAAVAMVVVALSLGLVGTPVGVADNGDGARLYCGAGLVPRTPDGRSNWQGGVVLDFTTGAPACPDPIASAALPVLRLATVGSGPTWSLTRLGVLYALAVGVLTGLAAWAVGPGIRLLALVPALVPLVGPTFTRFFLSTFSEPAGLLGAYALCLGAAVVAVTGRAERSGAGRRAGARGGGGLARGDGQGVVRPVARGGARRRRGHGGGASGAGCRSRGGGGAGAGGRSRRWWRACSGSSATSPRSTRTTSSTRPCCPTSARRRAGPARAAARGAGRRGPRLLPGRRRGVPGAEVVAADPAGARRAAYEVLLAHPGAAVGAIGRGLTATLGADLSYLPSAPVTAASVPPCSARRSARRAPTARSCWPGWTGSRCPGCPRRSWRPGCSPGC